MRRLIDAVKHYPIIAVSICSGIVAVLGVLGILATPIAAILQGLLSVVLGVAIGAGAMAGHQMIQHAMKRKAKQ